MCENTFLTIEKLDYFVRPSRFRLRVFFGFFYTIFRLNRQIFSFFRLLFSFIIFFGLFAPNG